MNQEQENEYTSIRIRKELIKDIKAHAKKYYPYGLPVYEILKLMMNDSHKYQEGLLRDSSGKFKPKE